MKISEKKEDCCGCTACLNVCPVNAIRMVEDSEGFLYPEIDKSKCIDCGACSRICPFLENIKDKIRVGKVFSCHTKEKELLNKSSSGGIFGELAKKMIERKGIVIGVNNAYKYVAINNLEELWFSKRHH